MTGGIVSMRKRRLPRAWPTMKFLAAWLVPWRPAFLTRAEPSGLRFLVPYRDGIGRQIAKYGNVEPELTAWMGAHLQRSPKGIVIDTGANLGWHSVHAAAFDSVENVVAFEPDAFNAWLLESNLALNAVDKVIVEACAVGSSRGMARLYRYKASNNGRHSLLTDYGLGSRVVPMIDVDGALDALGLADRRVVLFKIDVEGYEPHVIAGAMRTLRHTDVLVTEFSPQLSRSGDLPIDDMIDRLTGCGFVPNLLASAAQLNRIGVDDLRGIDRQVDVIWIRSGLPDAVADAPEQVPCPASR